MGAAKRWQLLAMNVVASPYTSTGDLVASFVFVRYTNLYLERKRVTAPLSGPRTLNLETLVIEGVLLMVPEDGG